MKHVSPLRVAALMCKQYNRYRSFEFHELFSSFYYQMSVEAKYPCCVASMNPREIVGRAYVGDY